MYKILSLLLINCLFVSSAFASLRDDLKVIKEIVAFYENKGSITKKEIKEIEKKYKEEEKAIKKLAADIRSAFLSAAF